MPYFNNTIHDKIIHYWQINVKLLPELSCTDGLETYNGKKMPNCLTKIFTTKFL